MSNSVERFGQFDPDDRACVRICPHGYFTAVGLDREACAVGAEPGPVALPLVAYLSKNVLRISSGTARALWISTVQGSSLVRSTRTGLLSEDSSAFFRRLATMP